VYRFKALYLVHGQHACACLLDAITFVFTVGRLVVGQRLRDQAPILKRSAVVYSVNGIKRVRDGYTGTFHDTSTALESPTLLT
jgi:hypothetical protein